MLDSAAPEPTEAPAAEDAPAPLRADLAARPANRRGRRKGVPNKATRDVRIAARKYTKRALTVLARLCEQSDDPRVQLQAAQELLDRAHGKPAQAVNLGGGETPVMVGRVDAESLDTRETARRLLSMAANAGLTEALERGLPPPTNGHALAKPASEPIDVEPTRDHRHRGHRPRAI